MEIGIAAALHVLPTSVNAPDIKFAQQLVREHACRRGPWMDACSLPLVFKCVHAACLAMFRPIHSKTTCPEVCIPHMVAQL